MKIIPIIISVVLILSLTAYSSNAQESEIGVEVGYGKTVKDSYRGGPPVTIFEKYFDDFLRIGLRYYYNFQKPIFNINTGLVYDDRRFENGRSTYLRVPLGIDFNIGRKFQFIWGVGLYFSYMLSFDTDFYETIETYSNFQVGWQFNVGIGVQISNRYNVSIRYQNNYDITEIYERKRVNHGGTSTEDVKGSDGFFSICLKYKFIKK